MIELVFYFGQTNQPRSQQPRVSKELIIPLFSKRLIFSLFPARRSKKRRVVKELRLPLIKVNLIFQLLPPRRKSQRRLREWQLPLGGGRALALALFPPRSKAAPKPWLIIPYSRRLIMAASLVLVGLVGSIYFGMQFARANNPPPANQTVGPPIPLETLFQSTGLNRSPPTALRIPAIGVNTSFIELGRKEDGTMEVPEAYEVVGWYKHAPTPGEVGPAIIVGHVDNYRGPAVFYQLGSLKPGDIIETDRADGTTVRFKVDGVKQFAQDNFPTAEVYGNLDHPGLRLITCGGQFSLATLRYDQNTVVFASLME